MTNLEVLFSPAEFDGLKQRNLEKTLCVVFDVFRATSSMITALSNGAQNVMPVAEISEALAIKDRDHTVLLAGERAGLRICADLTGGTDFDLGNSPREFTREVVANRKIVSSTTNGTRAIRACAHAREVLIGSFLNLMATAECVWNQNPEEVLIVCSGTFDQVALEDVLGAGSLCDLLDSAETRPAMTDSTLITHELYRRHNGDLLKAASLSRNGRRLLANPELRDDVSFCLQRDICRFAAFLNPDGSVTKV